MIIIQAEDLEPFLKWLETCPCKYTISSMQGGHIHAKFMLDTTYQQIVAKNTANYIEQRNQKREES